MAILIDGYNLLHASYVLGQGKNRGALERSRAALIELLARSIDDFERPNTTIVFDAAGAPPGLPEVFVHGGMTIRFSRGYASADELIEELIRAHHSPRKLVVVSSDHRLHRAANRRRATPIDSDLWIARTLSARRGRETARANDSPAPTAPRSSRGKPSAGAAKSSTRPASAKREAPESPPRHPALTEMEVEYWVREFAIDAEPAAPSPPGELTDRAASAPTAGRGDTSLPIFPAGYIERLIAELEAEFGHEI